MAWVKFDDQYADHSKIAGLSDAAFRLHTAGILYCGRRLTDGVIAADDVPRLVRKFRRKALEELLTTGDPPLWTHALDSYVIHDYLDWNDPADVVRTRREATARRKAEWLAKNGKGSR